MLCCCCCCCSCCFKLSYNTYPHSGQLDTDMEHLTLRLGIGIVAAKYLVAAGELCLGHILQTVGGPGPAKDILVLVQQLGLPQHLAAQQGHCGGCKDQQDKTKQNRELFEHKLETQVVQCQSNHWLPARLPR